MITGKEIKVDENYVTKSILYPGDDVVEGYGPVSKMNSFKGKLKKNDIPNLIAYLKYLKNGNKVPDEPAEATEAPLETDAAGTPEDGN